MRRADRLLILAAAAAAALPIVVSAIRVVADGWVPFADDALIATSALDVLTSDSPLLGPWSSGYSLRWASPAGMWVWLALGWSLATLLPPLPRPGPRPARALSAAGLALAVVVGVVVAADGRLRLEPYDEVRAVAERLDAALPHGGGVRVDVSSSPDGSFTALGFGSAVVYALRRDGRAVTAPTYASCLGAEYAAGASKPAERVVHVAVDRAPPRAAREIARDAGGPPRPRGPARRRPTAAPAARRHAHPLTLKSLHAGRLRRRRAPRGTAGGRRPGRGRGRGSDRARRCS